MKKYIDEMMMVNNVRVYISCEVVSGKITACQNCLLWVFFLNLDHMFHIFVNKSVSTLTPQCLVWRVQFTTKRDKFNLTAVFF